MKKLLFIILFILGIYKNGNAIDEYNRLQANVNNYRNYLVKVVKNNITKYHVYDTVEIKVFPSITIDYSRIKENIFFKLDSLANCFVISYDSIKGYDTTYFLIQKKPQLCYYSKRYSKDDISWRKIISIAEERSEDIFFLNFFYFNLYKRPIVGYFKNHKVEFIDHHFNTFKSIQGIIQYRYGSYNSFIQEIETIKYRKDYFYRYYPLDLAKAITYFKKEPINYIKYGIYNTDSLINAVFLKIKEFCSLSDYQKQELKNLLGEDINNKRLFKMIRENKELFNLWIDYHIRDVLNYDQLNNYLLHIDLFVEIEKEASDMINQYYNNVYLEKDTTSIADSVLEKQFYLKKIFGEDSIKGADTLYLQSDKVYIGGGKKVPPWR